MQQVQGTSIKNEVDAVQGNDLASFLNNSIIYTIQLHVLCCQMSSGDLLRRFEVQVIIAESQRYDV